MQDPSKLKNFFFHLSTARNRRNNHPKWAVLGLHLFVDPILDVHFQLRPTSERVAKFGRHTVAVGDLRVSTLAMTVTMGHHHGL